MARLTVHPCSAALLVADVLPHFRVSDGTEYVYVTIDLGFIWYIRRANTLYVLYSVLQLDAVSIMCLYFTLES